MQQRLFRKVALDRLSSPEQLDALMQVTRPKGWLVLGITVVMLAALIIWSMTAQIASTANGQGILVDQNGTLEVVLYLPAESAQILTLQMDVQISPVTISPLEYGYLKGEVIEIASQPVDDQYADDILPNQSAFAVRVRLETDESTPTGYAWTIGEGPDGILLAETYVTATITLKKERPLSRVLPVLD